MQSTATPIDPATSCVPCTIPLTSMRAAFATLPDPRRRQGTRYPLAAVLTLSVAAILSNHLTLLAIAEWGAAQSQTLKHALGFTRGRTPHVTTLQRLFRRLDPHALAGALTVYVDPNLPGELRPRGSQGVALDGKAQRGRLAFTDHSPFPMHAVSACAHDVGIVLAQLVVDTHAREGELTLAPLAIAQLDWQGRVLTGDALYCQRRLSAHVVEAGGDYLLAVDANQPTLLADIQQLFAPPPPVRAGHGTLTIEERQARQVSKGHGRVEVREIRVSSELAEYLDWPYLQQVFEVRRTWIRKGVTKQEVHYGITSLPQTVASPEQVLRLKRGHWGIENRLHYVKDVTLREDASTIHCGTGPDIMAMLRTAAVSALRRAGHHRIAARLRHNSRCPDAILALLGLSPR
ncbi:MAG TPA: ISAs1 family transposase [Chloroflexota bacterium]|nr:ISAs1 family transposase [Chloroflexota bacterium]